jgi:RNA 2',3'-cyclic 3'-phosphodiesterase
MRVFIAYVIDDHNKTKLGEIQQKLREIYPNGRFKPPQNMHMTLKFIGDVSVDQFESLTLEVDSVIHHHQSLNVVLNQLGCFGNAIRNHTLWIGCQSDPAMINLSEQLAKCAFAANIPISNTPFVPHITLAQHGTLRESLPQIEPLNVTLDQVCIFLSSRIEGELVYQPLKCWQLK